jgi:hypothetical protein
MVGMSQRAEQKARSAGLQLIAANAHLGIGIALYGLGQPKDAMLAYTEALQTSRRMGDRVQVANVYYDMSQALDDMVGLRSRIIAHRRSQAVATRRCHRN